MNTDKQLAVGVGVAAATVGVATEAIVGVII